MDLFKLFGTIAIQNSDANSALDETTGRAEDSQSKIVDAFKKIGSAVATYFAVDKIIAFGKEAVNVAAEVSAEVSAFDQIMGDYSEEASEKVAAIADATGMVDSRLTPYMTSMTAKFKGLGYDVEDATDYASRGLNLAADATAFWDKSLDESMSHLNSFISGSYEGGEAIGLFANETQIAAFAEKNGFLPTVQGATEATEKQKLALEKATATYEKMVQTHGEGSVEARDAALKLQKAQEDIDATLADSTVAWADLDEATKQAIRLEYAEQMFEQSGATGQAAKEAGQYANVQANLNEKWRQFKAQIGEPLLQNVVLPAMEKLSELVDVASEKIQALSEFVSENSETLENLGIVFGSVAAAILLYNSYQAIATAITTAKAAADAAGAASLWAYAAAQAAALLPMALVVAAIAAVIAIIVLCIKYWDEIKAFAIECAQKIAEKWQEFKETISTLFTTMMSKIISIWESIKSGITNKAQEIWTEVTTKFQSIKDDISTKLTEAKEKVVEIWDGIKSGITERIESARDSVNEAIEKIKSFFDFEWSLPALKLPHIRITGEWSFNPPRIPSFSVDWYKNGGILTNPTIFGMLGSKYLGGGEAGDEAVAPIDVLQGYVSEAVSAQNAGMVSVLERILDAIESMDANMGSNLREALDNTSLTVNNREFGRLVRTVI